ncbi:shieldin complex subunit 3 isoform X1 [Pungitius pungitius]|uniref:shieldin complex subunit 3 isoform X1 n=2 Tax=Pungitius pungitius TaxID=134920 RepID=UPI002E0D421D
MFCNFESNQGSNGLATGSHHALLCVTGTEADEEEAGGGPVTRMADVVLHYRPGSVAGLSGLLERAERLLESFPCRTPPVFTPWSPVAADRHLPIRPAKPPPVITGPPHRLPPEGRRHLPREPEVPRLAAEGHHDGRPALQAPLKRSWSVFTQSRVLQDESLSKEFRGVVAAFKLHLHQRAKWVIGRHNCGGGGDIEQVWRTLNQHARSSRLSMCNANIRRERAEIWVFCDVVRSEEVGRFLKEELQLSGRIELCVHRRGNVFSV